MDYLTYKIIMYIILALAVMVLLVGLGSGTWVHRETIAKHFSRATSAKKVTWDVPVATKRWWKRRPTTVSIKYDKLYP